MMKKHIATGGKVLGFLGVWVLTVIATALPVFDQYTFLSSDNAAVIRLWWELLSLLEVLFVTCIFVWLIERNRIKVSLFRNLRKSMRLGIVLGVILIGSTVLILYILGSFQLGNRNAVSNLPTWFLAVLLNATVQEYLVRGYLFSLFKEKYNVVVAVIVTTLFFIAMQSGVFDAGVIAVLNVMTMSIILSLLLIYTESLLAPIIVHFIWNGVGGLVLGGVSITGGYPSVWNCILTGDSLISGGAAKIEGSIIMLFMNGVLIIFMSILLLLKRRRV